jgi:hypothetical protein
MCIRDSGSSPAGPSLPVGPDRGRDSTAATRPEATPMPTARPRTPLRPAVTALLTGLILLLPAAPALAHGGGDSNQSRVLVLDALSYLANQPAGYEDSVTDKVGDALDAPDTQGVDLDKVAAAQQALKAGDMDQVRTLLQASLLPLTAPVTGEDTGTTTMLDPLPGHTTGTASTAALAGLSVAALLLGLGLARRWRPVESLAQLRRRVIGGEPR